MIKQKKTVISLLLTGAMVTSGLSITPLTVFAEDDDRYETKDVHIYRESMDEEETIPCLFYKDLPGIPYVEFTDFYSQLLGGESTVTKGEDGIYQIEILPDGQTGILDIENDTLSMDDKSEFLVHPDFLRSNRADTVSKYHPFLILSEFYYDPETAEKTTLDLGKYGIDVREEDEKVYFPLATLSDMFPSENGDYVSFNGESIYYNAAYGNKAKRENHQYIDYFMTHERSPELINFNYQELCFVYDNWYGYPKLHSPFSECMKEVGMDQALSELYPEVKQHLLSNDKYEYVFGLSALINIVMADGGHSYFGLEEVNKDTVGVYDLAARYNELIQEYEYSEEEDFYFNKYLNLVATFGICRETRNSILFGSEEEEDDDEEDIEDEEDKEGIDEEETGDDDLNDEDPEEEPGEEPDEEEPGEEPDEGEDPYEGMTPEDIVEDMCSYYSEGDTALIIFDSFIADAEGWNKFYKGEGRLPVDTDTYALILTCLNMASEDENIRNVVFDLTTNGGGDTDVESAILGMVLKKTDIRFYDNYTKHYSVAVNKIDYNLDGMIDEKDDEVDFSKFNFAVLTSGGSFSAANDFPCMMKDNGILVLGEQSGGGACAVGNHSTADGFCYTISSNFIYYNDAGESVDDGIPVDVELLNYNEDGEKDYSDFYDLSILSAEIHKFYGTTPANPSDEEEEEDSKEEEPGEDIGEDIKVIPSDAQILPNPGTATGKGLDNDDRDITQDKAEDVSSGEGPATGDSALPVTVAVSAILLSAAVIFTFSRRKERR